MKAALVTRLKDILGLKPQPTNLDAHKKKIQGSEDTGGKSSAEANDDTNPQTTKPLPPTKPPPPIKPAYVERKEDWIEYVSSGAGNQKYYYNPATGETKWTKPSNKPPPPAYNPPEAALVTLDNRHTQSGPVVSRSPGSGGSGGIMNAMLAALTQGGANITVNQAGAFAAGCNVYMGENAKPNGGRREERRRSSPEHWNGRHSHW